LTEVQQLVRRFRAAIASLAAIAVIDLLAVASGLWYSAYLRSLPSAAIVEELELVASEAAHGVVSILQFFALIAAAICFIWWFRQAYANVAVVTRRSNTHDPKWAIWGFVVPALNLVRPHQIMREIWDGSYARWVEEPSRTVESSPPMDLVNIWWGAFIVTCVLGSFAGRLSSRATTAGETVDAIMLYIFADAFDLCAAVVAIALVRNVTRLQRALLAERSPDGS